MFKKLALLYLLAASLVTMLSPAIAMGALAGTEYTMLEPEVVGKSAKATIDFKEYVGLLFRAVLVVTIILSVLTIVVGAVEYMTSAIPGVKADGIDKVKSALLGLTIALLSYMVLNTINPDLVKWKLNVCNLGDPNCNPAKSD